MNCNHCGTRIPRHAKLCPECGKPPEEQANIDDIAQEEEEEDAISCNVDSLDASDDTSAQNVNEEMVTEGDTPGEIADDDGDLSNDVVEQAVDNGAVADDDASNKDDVEQNNVASLDDAETKQTETDSDEFAQPVQVKQDEQTEQLEQDDASAQVKQVELTDQPEQSEQVDQPEQSDQVEQVEQSDQSEQVEQGDQPEQSEQVDEPSQPGESSQSDQPEQLEQSGQFEQVDQPNQPEPSDQPTQPDEPEQGEQQKISQSSQVNTRAVVIAVIIAILLVAVIVGVIWYMVTSSGASDGDDEQSDSASQEKTVQTGSNNFGNVLGEALYGSSEEVTVASDTFIMPQDLFGNSFEAYTVRAMAQSIPEENADRTRYVSSLQTESGFYLSEVFDDLSAGLYSIVIETIDGGSYVLPKVNYVADKDLSYSDDEAPIELSVRPPTYDEDKSEETQQACTLYYAKCLEYEELYGSRTNLSLYLTITGENEDPVEITPLLGFCSAHTTDFNEDGLDELVVVYYSDDPLTDENNSDQNTTESNASHYIVEVWEYDSGSIHRIYQGIPFVESNTAQVVVSLISWEDQTYLLGGTYTDNVLNISLYGYTAGALNLQHVITVSGDQQSATLDYQHIDDWLILADQMDLVWSEDLVYVAQDSASSFYKTLRDIRRIAGVAPASINDDSTFEYGSNLPDYSEDSGTDESLQNIADEDAEVLFEDNESDYLLPDADTRYYDESELEDLSDYELYLARNEIYARHGSGFESDELQEYFDSKSWYEQRYSADVFNALEDPLNAYEKANADLISAIEQERDSPYL